jgi:hypothetical protein
MINNRLSIKSAKSIYEPVSTDELHEISRLAATIMRNALVKVSQTGVCRETKGADGETVMLDLTTGINPIRLILKDTLATIQKREEAITTNLDDALSAIFDYPEDQPDS